MTPVERDRGPTSETLRRALGPRDNWYCACFPPVLHAAIADVCLTCGASAPFIAGVESCPHGCTEKRP